MGRLSRGKVKLNAGRGVYVSQSGESFYPEELIVPPESLAPFVPTPVDVVYGMLELAELKPEEVIYDLRFRGRQNNPHRSQALQSEGCRRRDI